MLAMWSFLHQCLREGQCPTLLDIGACVLVAVLGLGNKKKGVNEWHAKKRYLLFASLASRVSLGCRASS